MQYRHHSQFHDHGHDHLWCETALDHNCRIEALSHVEHQQHWMIRENTPSTDVSLHKAFKHLDYGIKLRDTASILSIGYPSMLMSLGFSRLIHWPPICELCLNLILMNWWWDGLAPVNQLGRSPYWCFHCKGLEKAINWLGSELDYFGWFVAP